MIKRSTFLVLAAIPTTIFVIVMTFYTILFSKPSLEDVLETAALISGILVGVAAFTAFIFWDDFK